MSTQVYQLSGGGTAALPNRPILSPRDPTTTDIVDPNGSPYQLLQGWKNTLSGDVFEYAGGGVWVEIVEGGGGGPITTINTNPGVAGNYTLAGTANQISVTQSTGTSTFALIGPYTPATYTAHGVLMGEGTSSIAASSAGTSGQVFTSGGASADGAYQNIGVNSGLTAHGVLIAEGNSAFAATSAGTAGQLLTSGGAGADPTWTTATFPGTVGATGTILRSNGTNWVASTDTFPDTVVAGDLLLATATNVVGSLADVAVGQVLASGGVGVVPAYTASPSVTGNMTAATGFVATTAGAGITLNSPAASGVAASPVVVNGRSGQATFTTLSIAAAADLTLTITNSSITGATTQVLYSMSGATTGAALSIKSVTNTAGSSAIVVTNGTGATTTTADIVMNFLVLN